jgi:hypothetical protein
MIKYDQLLDSSSFASLVAPWTPPHPLRRRRHTCAISGLYGVTSIHSKEVHATIPLIWQPALRAIFSFNFCSYLKIKFDAHPFVNNHMAELENEATQYESPNEGSRNVGSSGSYESPSPLQPSCAKRHQALGIEDPDYAP